MTSMGQTSEGSTCSQGDFLASLIPWQIPKEKATRMTDQSGRRWRVLFKKQGPLGSLVKTCLESSRWHCQGFSLTWRAWDTVTGVSLFQLVPKARHTGGTGFGLWPTPTIKGNYNKKSSSNPGKSGNGLATEMKLREGQTSKLHPTWVAWLMGYPLNWLNIQDGKQNQTSPEPHPA